MSVLVPPALDRYAPETMYSKYNFRQIMPEGGTAQPFGASTGQTTLQFRLPGNVVYSRGQCELSLTVTLAAGGAGNFNVIHAGCLPIDNFEVFSSRGTPLATVNNYRQFQKAVLPFTTPRSVMQRSASLSAVKTSAAAITDIAATALIPANIDKAYVVKSDGKGVDVGAPYLSYYPTIVGGDNAITSVNYRVPFWQLFPHSVLAPVQDWLPNEDIIIRLTFPRALDVGFMATNATTFAGAAAYAGSQTVFSNCFVWQACQLNQDICRLVALQTNSPEGLWTPVQYVRSYSDISLPQNGTTVGTAQRIFNNSMGSSILRIYSSVFQPDNGSTLSANNYNVSNVLFTQWREYYDSVATSDSALYLPDVFKQQINIMKDTCIANYDQWAAMGSVIVTDFSSLPGDGLAKVTPMDSGFSLNKTPQVNYAPEFTRSSTALGSTAFQWFVMTRKLQTSLTGIIFQ